MGKRMRKEISGRPFLRKLLTINKKQASEYKS
jgi:hypothetical protein